MRDQKDPALTATDDTSVVSTPAALGEIGVALVKNNNADGTMPFSDDETAAGPNQAVTFEVVITNLSPEDVKITSLTDAYPLMPDGFPITDCGAPIGDPIGDVIPATSSITCRFTIADYSPAPGDMITDTVRVTVEDTNAIDGTVRTDSAEDTSIVRTPPPPAISVDVAKTNDANGDGFFTEPETATAPGAPVRFRVVITNTSAVAVVLQSLTDEYVGVSAFEINACEAPVGDPTPTPRTVLAPAATVVCFFTVDSYAPPALGSITNTVTAVVKRQDGPDTATDSDTSVVQSPPPPPVLSVTVVKTNDADGNGTFSDAEAPSGPGRDVDFRALITNASATTVEIASLSDQWPGQVAFGVCPALIGATLVSGASATCNFTVKGYSPPAGSSLTDTVVAVVRQPGNPGNTATDDDDLKVVTALNPGGIPVGTTEVGGIQVTQPGVPAASPVTGAPVTLPVTGTGARAMVLWAVGLAGIGFGLRRLSRRSRSTA